jgi:hypothetical protein
MVLTRSLLEGEWNLEKVPDWIALVQKWVGGVSGAGESARKKD